MSGCDSVHEPVLLGEVLELLTVRAGGTYIDATVGGGGHARALLEQIGSGGLLLGIDQDRMAVERLRSQFRTARSRCMFVHGNFARIREIAMEAGVSNVDGILMDIGISSDQLNDPDRGFSFQKEGPLDMRMNLENQRTAAEIVNTSSEEELCVILREWGEERRARSIARAIVRHREMKRFETTSELADTVEKAVGGRRGRLHPATRTFQALRIEVNDELGALRAGLDGALALLADGGRMGVISFHSLEDRVVKHFFARHAGRHVSLAEGGSRWVGERPMVRVVTKKPVTASAEEQVLNRRSRSAKLRVAERITKEE